MTTYRLTRLEIGDEVPLPFEVAPDVDIKALTDRWTVLVKQPPESCRPITDLYVFSQRVPRPPSIFDSFVRSVFLGQLDKDPARSRAAAQEMVAKPKRSGIDPEKAVHLGRAILAYLDDPVAARAYVAELVESHMATCAVQDVGSEL
jgi:hypothetical protein